MGLSGLILKKKNYINTEKTINDIKKIASKFNLKFELRGKKYDHNNNFISANFTIYSINFEQNFIFYLFSLYDKLNVHEGHTYDWIEKDAYLADFLMIESFDKREKLLLDFLYEYFKLDNEEDYFWCEYEWFFDFNDIKKLKQEPFDQNWPYYPPK